MRVLQFGKYYVPYMGGIETHLATLCEGLQTRVEVTALVCNTEARTARESVRGVPVIRSAALGRVASTEICPLLPFELSRQRFDVVHIHTPNPAAMVAYLAAKKPRGHALVITHHSDIIRQRWLGKAFRPVFDAVMRRAHAVLVTSPIYLETSEELRPYASKCQVVPYGIDPQPFLTPDASAVAALRRRWGSSVVMAAGRLIYYKGFAVLLEAFREVPGQLVIVGDGPLRSELERMAARLGIAQRVEFCGQVQNSELPNFYAAADVFALPSVARSEAFGIVQLEAMAAGIPVVNTALNSGVPFVSLDGVTGRTVPPADSVALRVALCKLLADPVERRRMGSAGRARVYSEFLRERFIQRVLEIYRAVLPSNSDAAARAA
jgi:glycosyltransferase involved in cell wall biosynthesis